MKGERMKKVSTWLAISILILLTCYFLINLKLDSIAMENIKIDISKTHFNKISDKFNHALWNSYAGNIKEKIDKVGIVEYWCYFGYTIVTGKMHNDNSYAITSLAARYLIGIEHTKLKYGWQKTWFAVTRWISLNWTIEKCLNFLSNELYFGNGKHGIQEASQFYFKKVTTNLTDDEIQKLLELMKSPQRYKEILENKKFY
jgi:hypothetical protein